ncbi:MAG: chemotaxis protein CheA [Myxococcales bacterium]|nr:chemotaxis protein CheA [Myxococcales bacterium]
MAQRKSKSGPSKSDREFVSEAEEILEVMRSDIADLGDQRDRGGEIDPDLVNRLFRSAHSLKALAGLFRFDPIQDLAHRLEDILDGLRLGRVATDDLVMGLIDDSTQMFATLLGHIGDSDAMEHLSEAITSLTHRIENATREPEPRDEEFDSLRLDPSLLRALTEYEEHRLRENIRRGRCIALVSATFEIISFEEGLSELSQAIRDTGEVLSTLPTPGETPESQINFSLLVATEFSPEELASRIDFPTASVESVLDPSPAPTTQPPPAATPARAEAPAQAEAPPEPEISVEIAESEEGLHEGDLERAPGGVQIESLKSISETVRVDIRKLDDLMNLVGELVIQRGAMGELISQLSLSASASRLGNEFAKVHKALDRKLRELQSAVLEVRMVPLRQVFEKVSRVVRRLRRDLAKDVRLDIRGADTELDKLIVESLVDPLMHVVRNSLDHAIEASEERIAAGKSVVGCISIEAFQRGNHVVIAVKDDGRGIDLAALRARAEAAGLVSPGEALTEKESLDLIFAPGVSTREEVTETSGRGVGMDVVRSNLTALGGVVEVESIAGRGTTISMTLPITLAIIQSLIVRVGNQRFAVPLNAVMETLMIDVSEIQHSEGRELLNLRGDAIQVRRLEQLFDLPSVAPNQKPYVIVIGMGDQRVGLLVDRLESQQDTVIKPIQGPISAVRGIAGATDLGDQMPVLVLDVSALVEDAVRRREAA